MSDKFITFKTINDWLDDLDETLKAQIMGTALGAKEEREQFYNLYQAAQLLRARMLSDFSEEVEFNYNRYDG